MPSAGEHSEIQSDDLVGARGALRDAHLYRREHAMKIPRREFLQLAAGAVTLPAVSVTATAQTEAPMSLLKPVGNSWQL